MFNFWKEKKILCYPLCILSLIFFIIVRLRQFFIRSKKFSQNSIIIGNATLGGGGKTPSSIALGEILKSMNYNFSFLTKGYKGNIQGPEIVNNKIHSITETGDEARLLAATSQTIIAKNRQKAINFLKDNANDILILDDGFQNCYIKADIYILVIDNDFIFGNKLLFPAGPLRDSINWHLNKADCIFLVKNSAKKNNFNFNDKPIFELTCELSNLIDSQKKYFAFSALANNEKFFNFLESKKLRLIKKQGFKDHHFYNEGEISEMLQYSKQHNLTLITTEKDFVKIPEKYKKEIKICKIKLEFDKIEPIQLFLKNKLNVKKP